MGVGTSRQQLELELERKNAELVALQARVDALEAQANAPVLPDFVASSLVPVGSQALLGSGLGAAAGYALKVVGRIAAFGIGSGFIGLQTLSYLGYVQVDWRKVERDAATKLDVDGDGELTASDAKRMFQDVQEVLSFNLPAGSGFTAGLLWGLGLDAGKAGGTAAVASLAGRLVLPRVALGGATATSVPAAFVAAKNRLDGDEQSPAVAPAPVRK